MIGRAIIRVGDGRGFVVRHDKIGRLVITAAHCLPHLPPCGAILSFDERTYRSLLGPLGKECSVWAECLFADPIADIAVLGAPDDQELFDKCDAYNALMESAAPLPMRTANSNGVVEIMLLDGSWQRCTAKHYGGALWLTDAKIIGGMSGSPIVASSFAVGVLAGSSNSELHGPNPHLAKHLPAWLAPKFPARAEK